MAKRKSKANGQLARAAAMAPAVLLQLRKSAGLTQVELARRLGVKKLTVYRWESGIVPISQARALAISACVTKQD